MSSKVNADLLYTETHEWLQSGDEIAVGITDFGQQALGDLVFIELPEVGRRVQAGEAVAVVESVKAASDVYSPCAGEIVEINESLADSPELVNQSPYEAWLFRLKPEGAVPELMSAIAYEQLLEKEE